MEKLCNDLADIALRFRALANATEAEWLSQADPRAVQGGDFCEHAAELRATYRKLMNIHRSLEQ